LNDIEAEISPQELTWCAWTTSRHSVHRTRLELLQNQTTNKPQTATGGTLCPLRQLLCSTGPCLLPWMTFQHRQCQKFRSATPSLSLNESKRERHNHAPVKDLVHILNWNSSQWS